MRLINLTPHPFTLVGEDGDVIMTLDGADTPPRVDTVSSLDDTISVDDIDIDVYTTSFSDVQDMPVSQDGVLYIVSRIVAAALPDRDDLLIPNDLVRDDQGRVIGCRSLTRP